MRKAAASVGFPSEQGRAAQVDSDLMLHALCSSICRASHLRESVLRFFFSVNGKCVLLKMTDCMSQRPFTMGNRPYLMRQIPESADEWRPSKK